MLREDPYTSHVCRYRAGIFQYSRKSVVAVCQEIQYEMAREVTSSHFYIIVFVWIKQTRYNMLVIEL